MAQTLPIAAVNARYDVGPGHEDGVICPDLTLCKRCQGRILQLYTKFFQVISNFSKQFVTIFTELFNLLSLGKNRRGSVQDLQPRKCNYQ